jgi:Ca-activated chloride channel family protein
MADDDRFFVGPPSAPDRYMLVDCLGVGGEGEVWTAQLRLSPQGRRKVAVKILRDNQIGRNDESWEHHADLLRNVSHPGLVRVVEVFTGARRHRMGEAGATQHRYVVMDLVKGESLRDWLAENPESRLTDRLRTLRNVAAALDEMHSGNETVQPVAHGDVKPGNIVVRDDGSTVLVDLGLMRISDGTAVAGATEPYAAPELFRDGALTTPEADRFAFAATVVHLVLGEPPPVWAPGQSGRRGPDLDRLEDLLRMHPLSARLPLLRRQVMQALTVPPDQRPANLSRWLSSLTDALSQVTIDEPPRATPDPEDPGTFDEGDVIIMSGSGKDRRFRNRTTAAALTRVAMLASAGLVAKMRPGARHSPAERGRLFSRRNTALTLAGAALLAGSGLVAGWPDSHRSPGAGPALAPCTGPATEQLLVFASQDKAGLLGDLAHDLGLREADGRCISITVKPRNSGQILTQLTQGWTETDGPRPDVWSPASSTWLARTRYLARPGLLPDDAPQLFRTPVVIAMPKPMAEALGWPNARIGWDDLAALARDQRGWGAHGHPEWGPFRLGKTNPQYSASGFTATIGAYFAATGRGDELTIKDVDDRQAQDFVRSIERSVVHYGDTTLTFLRHLRQADDAGVGLSYVSAVPVEESSLVAYNLGYPCGAKSAEPGCDPKSRPRTPLVAIYPREGTLVSDHPYLEMPGLSRAKKAMADAFLQYIRSDQALAKIGQYGFRSYQGRPTGQITAANGAAPTIAVPALGQPSPAVLDEIVKVWPTLRKPANVLLLIDTSGSMNDMIPGTGQTKIARVQQAKGAILPQVNGFSQADRVGLWRFGDQIDGRRDYLPLVPVAAMDPAQRRRIGSNIDQLPATGGTALYSTIDAAVSTIRASWDPGTINAVVVLTDGRNETSHGPDLDELLTRIRSTEKPVRVFTIAYGSKADEQDKGGQTVLERISLETGAERYDATDATTINNVLKDVISNF